MFEKVKRLSEQEEFFQNGEWQEHFGDGCLFGPSFDVEYGLIRNADMHLNRGLEALEQNAQLVEEASEDLLSYNEELEFLSMSLLSLSRVGPQLEKDYVSSIDPLLSSLDTISIAMGDYFELTVGSFATTSYGPTAVSNFLAINHIERAAGYTENSDFHFERANTMLSAIHDVAWDEELETYRFAREDTRRMLYPNITFMLSYARMYQETGDVAYLESFYRTYEGIVPLKADSGDHYHSPYSFESMGATDEDYSTLSSQNYLMLALLSAYQSTGDQSLLEEVDTILTFIETHMMEGDLITHHWIDGRAANHEDPWYFCMGCNLQTLYILVIREMIRREDGV